MAHLYTLILYLAISVCIATAAVKHRKKRSICSGSSMTDAARNKALSKHNNYRSMVALGKAKDQNGRNVPSASNMYKLVYNCDLEATAQQWADKCEGMKHSERLNTGENIYGSSASSSTESAMESAVSAWFAELADPEGTDGHYTQVVWDYTSSIGCGYKVCNGGDYVVCQYKAPGNHAGLRTYETGTACSCDNPNAGSCVDAASGLCTYTGLHSAAAWKETECQDHPNVGCDAVRIKGWCAFSVSCSVTSNGWCDASKYCKKSCDKCESSKPAITWSEEACQNHPEVACDYVESHGWCGYWVSCRVTADGWCDTDKYCKESCTSCT